MPIPEASVPPVAVVPVNRGSKHADIGQRSTRWPFYVSEVKAIVRAIEKLETGRYTTIMHLLFVDFWCSLDLFLMYY